jgi:hypothetical protein
VELGARMRVLMGGLIQIRPIKRDEKEEKTQKKEAREFKKKVSHKL